MDTLLRKMVRAVRAKLEDMAGQPLDDLLGRCAEARTVYPDTMAFADDAALRRLLSRVGLIRRNCSQANLYELVQRIAKASGERQARARRVLEMYCAPAEGIPRVICDEVPNCDECPLAPDCKFFHRTPSITDLPEDQRPRERLIAEGGQALADAELLAIILRSGTEQDTAIGLAHKLIARFGNFRALAVKTAAELQTVKGIGVAKAAQIKAAIEIGRRLAQQQAAEPGRRITDSLSVYQHCEPMLRDHKKESFLVLLLDTRNRVVREVTVSEGSLTASIVHPREVFNEAVRDSAAAVVCVHNHPSGDPTPSPQDREVTRRLVATGKLLGIHVLDHIVVGNGTYYSFADEGQIPPEKRDDG